MRILCSRIQPTASKPFTIIQYLKGRTNLGRSIPQLDVDRMEVPDSADVHNVFEVPTHKYIRLGYSCQSHMFCIRP